MILEEFLEHIENCSSCYDELATYFIVHKAMEQLDEKQEDSVLDFRELLEEDHLEIQKDTSAERNFTGQSQQLQSVPCLRCLWFFSFSVILEIKEGI